MFLKQEQAGDIKQIEYNYVNNSFASILIKDILTDLVTPEDKMLLNLAFSKEVSQENLNKFFEKWDIEAIGGNKSLMLSYFMRLHPELNYP